MLTMLKNYIASPYIIKIIKEIEICGSKAILLERFSHTLYDVIYILEPLSCQLIAFGLLTVLKQCHKCNITHRDLKLNNVMVDDNYIPKIIDWGSANDTDRKTGTPMYYAPEALDENKALDYLVL